MDYRNAYLWYQWDPTKWFIAMCSCLGLATNLKVFSGNEIEKGMLTMELKRLKKVQDGLVWPLKTKDLAVWTWDRCERPIFLLMCDTEPLVITHSQARVRYTHTSAYFGVYP